MEEIHTGWKWEDTKLPCLLQACYTQHINKFTNPVCLEPHDRRFYGGFIMLVQLGTSWDIGISTQSPVSCPYLWRKAQSSSPVFTWLVFLVTNPHPKATKSSLSLGYLIDIQKTVKFQKNLGAQCIELKKYQIITFYYTILEAHCTKFVNQVRGGRQGVP